MRLCHGLHEAQLSETVVSQFLRCGLLDQHVEEVCAVMLLRVRCCDTDTLVELSLEAGQLLSRLQISQCQQVSVQRGAA